MRKKSLMEAYGNMPEGMSRADAEAVLQFLYGAFDRQTARQVKIVHPYLEESDENAAVPPELTVLEFCRWLEAASAA